MPSLQKTEQELTRLSLAANAAIQDIHIDQCDISEYLSKAKSLIAAFREKIEEVDENAKLADKESDKLAMEKLVRDQRNELARLNGMLRKVNFTLQIELEKKSKEALMGDNKEEGLRKRIQDKKSAAKANSAITDSLVKTSRLMAEHLHRSNDTIETLANSSKGITTTTDELRNMQGHIKNSHSLLTKYGRRETTDKLFIFLAMVFFLATILYILKKRLWSASIEYSSASEHSSDTVMV